MRLEFYGDEARCESSGLFAGPPQGIHHRDTDAQRKNEQCSFLLCLCGSVVKRLKPQNNEDATSRGSISGGFQPCRKEVQEIGVGVDDSMSSTPAPLSSSRQFRRVCSRTLPTIPATKNAAN